MERPSKTGINVARPLLFLALSLGLILGLSACGDDKLAATPDAQAVPSPAISKNANANFGKGGTYAEQGQYELAIAEFTKAIELDPNYAPSYASRGSAYGYLGEYQKAIDDYTKAIELDPTYPRAYINRGLAYSRLGESYKANQDKAKACELDPSYC
jgi:tetratricopeptide (TPR) repeat protein